MEPRYLLLLLSLLLVPTIHQTCERCVCPCSQSYCNSDSTNTWNSSFSYTTYSYTKLVLAINSSACMPCAYSCQICTSQYYTSCTTCLPGFYNINSTCHICPSYCATCAISNNLTICMSCLNGTYLDTTGNCRSCPDGAFSCTSTSITACIVGYYSVSAIVCLPCSSNCQSCNSATCQICVSGYYLSSGNCLKCSDSCLTCTSSGCSSCPTGFYLLSRQCLACPSHCNACSASTPTKCTTCQSGYYNVNGICNLVSNNISSCNIYSSGSVCSSCTLGTYLSGNQCLPCSISCSNCWGSHFGLCSSCSSNFNIFNLMCIASNFPNSLSYQLYFHLPSYQGLFSGGSVSTCVQSVYQGNSISLKLNNLAASSITVKYKLYLIDSTSASYSVGINNQTATSYSPTNSLNSICSTSTQQMYDIKSLTFTNLLYNNTLIFSSTSTLAISQILVLATRCTSLCSVCTATLCSSCLLSSLYTQNDECVYACSNSFYAYETNRSCLTMCPAGTYTVSTNLTCVDCTSPCATCNSSTSCLSCKQGYFLYNNTCKQTCPLYYYPLTATYVCSICVGRCLTCQNATFCLSCLTGFLYQGQCLDNCSTISGMYSNISTLGCSNCDSSCLNCTSTSTICTACNPSTPLLFNSTCSGSCPGGYYNTTSTCYRCSYPCLNCAGSATNCTSCLNNYAENGICVSSCSIGSYADLSTMSCLLCDIGCATCIYNQKYCSTCNDAYYFYSYQCLTQCPDGFYGQNKVCKPCILPCLRCKNQSFCLSCQINFLNSTLGTCVNQADCYLGYYADINSLSCLPCDSQCLSCVVKPNLCTSCNSPLYLLNYSCVSQCSTYMYPNSVSQCTSCISPCLTCTNSTFCTSCISGYIYYSVLGSCLSYCPSGQYISSEICYPCQSNCLSCTNESDCQKCSSDYYLYAASSSCVSNCTLVNSSFYGDPINSICSICISPCLTCSNIVDCLSCITGLLYQNRCISTCPFGYFANGDVCQQCSSTCSSCIGTSSNCTSCSNKYLYQSSCFDSCPISFYPNQVLMSCEKCPSKCASCLNFTYCTSCVTGYLDSSHNCISSCPMGYFMSNTYACVQCDSKCQSCNGSSTNCLSCKSGFYLSSISLTSSTCRSSCLQTQYLSNNICYNCSSPCLTCESASSCITCIPGTLFYSLSNSCLSSCPLGTYNSSNQCKLCVSPCNTCSNSSYCLTCTDNSLFISMGQCVSQCPTKFYGQQSTMICVSCGGLCETCNSSLYCLSCKSGYLIDGFCYDICPLGTFSSGDGKCEKCESPCLTCWQSSTSCIKCIDGLLFYNSTCNSQCPNNTYLESQICVNCPFPCITCSSSVVCSSCLGGYLLYLNTTCIEGPSCPNGLYNMNGIACVMEEDCPNSYYLDNSAKTCSSACQLGRYTFKENRTCLDSCPEQYYTSYELVCQNFDVLNQTLMGSKAISYILSSELFLQLQFNQTISWDYAITNETYTITQLEARRRLLSSVSVDYSLTDSPNIIELYEGDVNLSLNLPAYYLKSSLTNLPLQTPNIQVISHTFLAYTEQQKHTASLFFQISQSLGWIILTISVGFLAINRLSDIYILWDFPQLLYMLIYLDIQYPPNLNQYLRGLRNLNLYFFPNVFKMPEQRQSSPAPFYAQSYDVNFLRCTGHILIVFLIYAIVYLILKASYLILSKSQKLQTYTRFKKIVYKGLLRYRWHYTNDFFFVTILNVLMFAFSQIWDLSDYYLRIASFVLIIICLVVYIGFPIFVATKLYRHIQNIRKGKLIQNLKCFYRGIQKTNSFGVSLILLRYLRKIFYAVCIPLLSSHPLFVLPILTVCSFLFALFIWSTRPYKKKISNIINVITEVSVVCILLLISIMQFQYEVFSIDANWIIGWICSILITAIIFTQLFYIFCKTMFYLEPQRTETMHIGRDGKRTSIKTKSFILRKAEQFFNKVFPNLRYNIDLSDSSDDQNSYSEGDSQNSQNNDFMRQAINIEVQNSQSQQGDKFYHYDSNSNPSLGSRRMSIPKYLIKCVNDIQKGKSSTKL